MIRRLEELGLVKSGTGDWFEDNGGITDEQVRQVLGDLALPDTSRAETPVDHSKPDCSFIQLLQCNLQFMNEVCPAFGGAGFAIIGCRSRA